MTGHKPDIAAADGLAGNAVLTLARNAHPSHNALCQVTGDEAVILDMASEQYFGLDRVGRRVWELLSVDSSLEATHQTLLAEFDVDAERMEHDLLALVGQLSDAGLVTLD